MIDIAFVAQNSLELGLLMSLVAIGVYLTFRILDIPDLTVDGSFALGAAVCAVAITKGYAPVTAILFALISGVIAGYVTGILTYLIKIPALLAGILTMISLYSINIRIMGSPNIALYDNDTVFHWEWFDNPIFVLLIIVSCIYVILCLFFNSQFGLAIRAIGRNPILGKAYGFNIKSLNMLTLGISNGLIATSGALFAQLQGFADVSIGYGTLIIGIASVFLGECLFKQAYINLIFLGCVLGSIIYRVCITLALDSQIIGLMSSDLNLVTALILILSISIPKLKQLKIKQG